MTGTPSAHRRTSGLVVSALCLAVCASTATALPASPADGAPLAHVVVVGTGAADAVVRAGGSVLRRLPLVGGVDALVPRSAPLPRSLQVTADRPLTVAGLAATPAAGTAAPVRAVLGLGAPAGEGAGVTVAVVDTGVAAGLPGLEGRVEHVSVAGPAGDGLGHGTFIAGLVAGSGDGTGGRYAGVAPAAHVLDVKVAQADGSTSLSAVLGGLQLAADKGVDVVNLSLSSGSPLPTAVDPLAVALDRLWADGVTVVVASGNDGTTVSSPGDDPLLLTVGGLADAGTAERRDDTVAAWSGRGAGKPDLVAPGASVVSLLAPGSAAQAAQTDHGLPAGYGVGSGTSFATAVASGSAAALLGARPALLPGQVKDLLASSAYKVRGARDGDGAGGLDLAAALGARTPKVDKPGKGALAPVPAADQAAWEAFVAAVLDGDAEAAARTWADLSPQARTWAARTWAGMTPTARTWAARTWAARTWAGSADGEDVWAARTWAARTWAARTWASGDWSAADWTARTWAARTWAGTGDSETAWQARTWAARTWGARTWAVGAWS